MSPSCAKLARKFYYQKEKEKKKISQSYFKLKAGRKEAGQAEPSVPFFFPVHAEG